MDTNYSDREMEEREAQVNLTKRPEAWKDGN